MSEYENFNDPDIYKNEDSVDLSLGYVISNFLKLLNTYHILFLKNIVTKNAKYRNYIYLHGMKCINHIFIFTLQYTNNMAFTYYHCEKGIYYFTEFITQIENENSFLKLTSTDAIIFVYKKTIYNINKKLVNGTISPIISKTNDIIRLIIKINTYDYYDILQPYYMKLINRSDTLGSIEIKLEQCSSLKSLEETLKQEL